MTTFRKIKETFRAFLLVVPLLLVISACRPPSEEKRFHVVTSIMPLSYFVERIGGNHVTVSVMVPPGGDPHSYEPTPKQMVSLRKSALFIKTGSGIEFELDWMPRILSLNPGLSICDASEGVQLIPMTEGEDVHGEEHHGVGAAHQHLHHQHAGTDPHYWLTPENGMIMTRNIARALAEADPSHKETYSANAAALIGELQSLDREIKEKIAGARIRKFLVFHPAWGYYAHTYGLEQIAAEAEGKTLTPVQMQHVIQTARKNRIKVVFISPQFNSSQAEAIAAEIEGRILAVDPLSADYQENLRRATSLFLKAGHE
ncbi:MAG: zinc ABC transporter solute-binding protein [Chlorobiaceae bacterium]|jgi:zinc transport system substrate-binding protein|nr:zinc ABC transporter solute-binding protein [Chlorobiaceae bacterium]